MMKTLEMSRKPLLGSGSMFVVVTAGRSLFSEANFKLVDQLSSLGSGQHLLTESSGTFTKSDCSTRVFHTFVLLLLRFGDYPVPCKDLFFNGGRKML